MDSSVTFITSVCLNLHKPNLSMPIVLQKFSININSDSEIKKSYKLF